MATDHAVRRELSGNAVESEARAEIGPARRGEEPFGVFAHHGLRFRRGRNPESGVRGLRRLDSREGIRILPRRWTRRRLRFARCRGRGRDDRRSLGHGHALLRSRGGSGSRRESDHPQHRHLEADPRVRRPGEVPPAHDPDLIVELKGLRGDPGRERPQGIDLLVVLATGRNDLKGGHPPEGVDDFAEEHFEIRRFPGQAVQRRDHGRGVGGNHRLEEREQPISPHRADEGANIGGGDPPGPVGARLVQQAEGVAHAPVCGAAEHAERLGIGLDRLLPRDPGEFLRDLVNAEAPQPELETTRQDGDREALRIGGGEQELDVRGWLFERLEERVEAVAGEHVHLVDEVHLETGPDRGVLDVVEKVPGLLHPGARGRVHFDEIDVAPLVDLAAGPALAARPRGRAVLAVEALREDPGDSGLADPARSREQIGMVQPVALEGVDEGPHHVLLAHDGVEAPRTPLAGERLVAHDSECPERPEADPCSHSRADRATLRATNTS